MTAKRLVSVRILGHEYRIRTDADPAGLARVAELVDETMGVCERTGDRQPRPRDHGRAQLARDLSPSASSEEPRGGERVRALTERVEVIAAPDPGS
jgi:hypothetical protein